MAYDLLTRLPAVHAAMDVGVLDEPRARVFSEWTSGLSPEAARAVCAELLPRAPKLTTGQLIEQIKKLAIALDPQWAQRRYEQAVADRKVVGYRNSDGSANLSGYNLPVDRVAVASGHIDALAKAAKHAGDSRPIDHIRADLFLGMTDGTYAGLDDTAILEHLRVTQGNEVVPDDEADDEAGGSNDDEADGPEDNSDGPEDNSDGPEDGGPEDGRAAEGGHSVTDELPQRRSLGAGIELRVRLSTLMRHDQYPAELAGWGPVHADLARELANTLGGAQWRFVITDEHGQLSHCGITQSRSTGVPARMVSDRGTPDPRRHPARTSRALHRVGRLGPCGE